MPFFARVILSFIVFGISLALELWMRKKKGLSPSNWSELRRYLTKTSSPNKEWSPLIFAFVAIIFFCIWEGLIFYMIGRAYHMFTWVLAFLLWLVFLFRRRKVFVSQIQSMKVSVADVLLFTAMWVFMYESILGILYLFWIYIRSRFLTLRKSVVNSNE